MKDLQFIAIFAFMLAIATSCFSLKVYDIDTNEKEFSINQLRKQPKISFTTVRNKDGLEKTETWEGLNLGNWLLSNGYNQFQSIRFESDDNYMVRIHKAELDTMQGFIALKRDDKMLDSTEVRVIFPAHRDMYWVRGITKIFLDDFKTIPPPDQIYIWEAIISKLEKIDSLKPFYDLSGFYFEPVMHDIFHQDDGSVIFVCRDGIKSRLEFSRHLKGAILEVTPENGINLKSPVIPAGMWLKDVVYLQCGPFAVIRQDYLYQLPSLCKALNWPELHPTDKILRTRTSKSQISLESLSLPDSEPLSADEWIELP